MKRSFTLYNDSLDILDELTDEQAGKLFKAIREFNRGKEIELDMLLRVCFAPFKNQFIRHGIGLTPQEISEINKANRNKGITTKHNEVDENDESVHKSNSIVNVVVEYLNSKVKSDFSPKTKNTIKHIMARVNEGRTEEDFKKVIDTKVAEWIGTEQAKYLRPDTLFGSKFEGYLNQKAITSQKPQKELSAIEKLIQQPD